MDRGDGLAAVMAPQSVLHDRKQQRVVGGIDDAGKPGAAALAFQMSAFKPAAVDRRNGTAPKINAASQRGQRLS